MNPLSSGWRLPLALAFIAGGFACGVFINAVRTAQIAGLEAAHAAQQTAVAHASLQRWQAAAARADAAESRLAQQASITQQTLKEKQRGLSSITTGRPCLSGPAVGLLNGTGLRLSAVPAPAGPPDPAAAAFASDTDVGGWIAAAQSQYEQCRDTRQALIEWGHD
jgi:hypothetical protein